MTEAAIISGAFIILGLVIAATALTAADAWEARKQRRREFEALERRLRAMVTLREMNTDDR